MNKFKIYDKVFCPIQHPIMWGHKNIDHPNLHNYPKHIEWIRGSAINNGDVVFFTDFSLREVLNINVDCLKIAWLIEPYEVWSDSYNFLSENHHLFDLIFTFEESLLRLSDKVKIVPSWCSWIRPEHHKIHEKSKTLSIIASNKGRNGRDCSGHRYRHQVIDSIRNEFEIDIFGGLTSGGVGYNPIMEKEEALSPYMYSLVIENSRSPYWFSEKIIDCLLTGTVPIYWGASKIGEYFNMNGFLTFDTIDDLKSILKDITKEKYDSMLPYVMENFKIASQWVTIEDFFYENHLQNYLIQK